MDTTTPPRDGVASITDDGPTARRWINKIRAQSLLTRNQLLLCIGMIACELVIIFGGSAIYLALEGHGAARTAPKIPWTYADALYFSCVNLCRIGMSSSTSLTSYHRHHQDHARVHFD